MKMRIYSGLVVTLLLITGCASRQEIGGTEKISYICESGERFFIEYPRNPGNHLEVAALERFAPVYGELPKNCRRLSVKKDVL